MCAEAVRSPAARARWQERLCGRFLGGSRRGTDSPLGELGECRVWETDRYRRPMFGAWPMMSKDEASSSTKRLGDARRLLRHQLSIDRI